MPITRRYFLNGSAITIAAGLTSAKLLASSLPNKTAPTDDTYPPLLRCVLIILDRLELPIKLDEKDSRLIAPT